MSTLIGVGGYSDASSPTRVQLPSDLRFTSVYTCADTSFAWTSESNNKTDDKALNKILCRTHNNCTCTFVGDGLVYGWGNNEYGQVGVATDDPQISTPIHLDLSDLDGRLVSMATGGAFTAFLTSNSSTKTKKILVTTTTKNGASLKINNFGFLFQAEAVSI